MDLVDALLDSWDRQCRIVSAVAAKVDEGNRQVRPSDDGWPLDFQLAHVHQVRRHWLGEIDRERAAALPKTFLSGWEGPIDDLDEIRRALEASALAVREAMREALTTGRMSTAAYDHPVLFLQHMVWHEGWHVGLLMLGLRRAGQEPYEEWEEANLWSHWRTER